MKLSIKRRLAPCQPPESGDVSPCRFIGMATDRAINHSHDDVQSVSNVSDRLIPSFETGQARNVFDVERRPYGRASLPLVPEDTNQALLTGEGSDFDLIARSLESTGTHLWFLDFLCSFCSPLAVLQRFKENEAAAGQHRLTVKEFSEHAPPRTVPAECRH